MTQDYTTEVLPAVDVVVVGGGLSGLAAADKLARAGKTVTVLEARDRVGGKVYDPRLQTIPGGYVEAGASYIGPGQDRVQALADRLNIGTYENNDNGHRVLFVDGQRIVLDPADETSPPDDATVEYIEASGKLESMAQELDIAAPWDHHQARAWDSMTLATWLDQHMPGSHGRALMEMTVRSLLSADVAEVSLLQTLIYIARATDGDQRGSWHRLTAIRGGGQDKRISGGPQSLAVALAATLKPDTVRFNVPVTRITKEESSSSSVGSSSYQVCSETGRGLVVVPCRAIILALSPPLVTRIRFEPALPAAKDLTGQNLHMGSLGKAIAVYKTPFWREQGLSGQAICPNGSIVQLTFDATPEDGSSFGAIQGFLEANELRGLENKTDAEIQELVKRDYINFFGPQAADVVEWQIQRWNNEEYSRGGHFAIAGPNVITQFAKYMAQPVGGGIFFAGTELATRWAGFMDGAIRAGEKAADDVCEVLL